MGGKMRNIRHQSDIDCSVCSQCFSVFCFYFAVYYLVCCTQHPALLSVLLLWSGAPHWQLHVLFYVLVFRLSVNLTCGMVTMGKRGRLLAVMMTAGISLTWLPQSFWLDGHCWKWTRSLRLRHRWLLPCWIDKPSFSSALVSLILCLHTPQHPPAFQCFLNVFVPLLTECTTVCSAAPATGIWYFDKI